MAKLSEIINSHIDFKNVPTIAIIISAKSLEQWRDQTLALETALEDALRAKEEAEDRLTAIHPIINGADEQNWRDCLWEIQKLAILDGDAQATQGAQDG